MALSDAEQADLARHAFRRFGRGRHAAALNFGDCFAYALAAQRCLHLLFKGGDLRPASSPPPELRQDKAESIP